MNYSSVFVPGKRVERVFPEIDLLPEKNLKWESPMYEVSLLISGAPTFSFLFNQEV